MIFGTKDPHIPDAGRETIDRVLKNSGACYKTVLYKAEHAFGRDEGPRYDPEATDLAFGEMIGLFRRVFSK
jgi:carboxymethylenebutenolidase